MAKIGRRGAQKHFSGPGLNLPFQSGSLCTPKQRECLEQGSSPDWQRTCGSSCLGIYADVNILEEKIENSNFDVMISKYRDYKRNYVKNIGFNSSNYNTNFGELITSQAKSFKFLYLHK